MDYNHLVREALAAHNIVLAAPPAPIAGYVGFIHLHGIVTISGQLPLKDGKITKTGHLGAEISPEEGYAAARLCAINILSHLSEACSGDWQRVQACMRLGIFVSCKSDFTQHPAVADGASDLMKEILGECGTHARATVGVSALPMNSCVEVEVQFALSTP